MMIKEQKKNFIERILTLRGKKYIRLHLNFVVNITKLSSYVVLLLLVSEIYLGVLKVLKNYLSTVMHFFLNVLGYAIVKRE